MKIGGKLYKYLTFNGFGTYLITAVITREKAIMYELECQACAHGEKCRLLVTKEKGGKTFRFCSMLNDNEDEPQQMWHDDDIFYASLDEARKAKYLAAIRLKEKEIEKQKKGLESLQVGLDDLRQHYENIKTTKPFTQPNQ